MSADDLAAAIAAGNRELVAGSKPTTAQAAMIPGVSQLQRSVRTLEPNELTAVAQAQNAARLAALDQLAPGARGRTAIEAADNAGSVLMGEAEPRYAAAKTAVGLLAESVDPFGQARIPLPLKYVDETVGKYFGKGAGAMPGDLSSLVDDIKELGTPQDKHSGLVDWQTLQNLRSRASEAGYKLGQAGDRRAAAVAGAIKDHLDATLEEVGGRAAARQVLDSGQDVPSAMYRKGLGEIDFPYGEVGTWNPKKGKYEGGSGILHVVSQRARSDGQDGRAVAMSLPEILARGEVGPLYGSVPGDLRRNVRMADDAQAVLSQRPDGHWLMSGWNDPAGTMGIGAPGGGPVVHSGSAYIPDPSVIQNQAGAGAEGVVGLLGEYFHPDMAKAARDMRRARIDQAQRFETGPAGLLWKDGADGAPRLQGAERIKAFVNARDTQSADVAQLLKMVESNGPTHRAAKDYAITDLIEQATQRGMDADAATLLPAKFGNWMDRRSGMLKGLLEGDELGQLGAVRDDLNRAARAEALGQGAGSNTAEKLGGLGLLDSPWIDRGLNWLPLFGAKDTVRALLGSMRESGRKNAAKQVAGALVDPEVALRSLRAYGLLMQPNALQRQAYLGGLRTFEKVKGVAS
jgi:hypothetical protein